MDYPLSLSYAKPQSPIFTNISKRISTNKLPYFVHSRAQRQASINIGRLVVRANTHNNVTLPSSASTTPADDGTDRGTTVALIKSSAARAAGASLALACIVGALSYGLALISPGKAAAGNSWTKWPSFTSSSSGQYPEAGQQKTKPVATTSQMDALKSFFEVMVYLASPAARSLPTPRINIRQDVYKLKREALEKIKRGENINNVLVPIEKKRDEFSNSQHPDLEGKYFVEMALVEILISQGKYKKASEYRDFLEGKTIRSDTRPSLYKAIIYTMLDNDKNNNPSDIWNDFFQSDSEDALPNPGGSDPTN